MGTTIINPAQGVDTSDNNGMSFLAGAVVLVLFAVLFFVFAFPYLRGRRENDKVQVNVPKSINVNVVKPKY